CASDKICARKWDRHNARRLVTAARRGAEDRAVHMWMPKPKSEGQLSTRRATWHPKRGRPILDWGHPLSLSPSGLRLFLSPIYVSYLAQTIAHPLHNSDTHYDDLPAG